MSIHTTLERFAAQADRFVTAHEPLLRSLALGAGAPNRGECRSDTVVLGIFAGAGALVIAASFTLIAMRYYVA